MNVLDAQHKEDVYNQAQTFHPTFVANDGQPPELFVSSEFVIYCSEILTS